MFVRFGNANALEGYRDPTSEEPEAVRYRPLRGQHVTTIAFPEGEVPMQEAFRTAVAALAHHMETEAKPAWIESDNQDLRQRLEEHFGIEGATRPDSWGRGARLAEASTDSATDEAQSDAKDKDDKDEGKKKKATRTTRTTKATKRSKA